MMGNGTLNISVQALKSSVWGSNIVEMLLQALAISPKSVMQAGWVTLVMLGLGWFFDGLDAFGLKQLIHIQCLEVEATLAAAWY